MGAWGFKSFENDDASDWVYALADTSGSKFLVETFQNVLKNDDLEVTDSTNGIAAAEVVAALRNAPAVSLPDDVKNWVVANRKIQTKRLQTKALKTIERVRTKSELQALYEDAGNVSDWHTELDELIVRLNK